MGLFLTPMSDEHGWSRNLFGFAIALQNLLWGIGAPFAGAVADRFGPMRVLSVGGALYALGLAVMALSDTALGLNLGAGVLIGFGLAGCSFNVVLGAFGKLMPAEWRGLSFGAATAAGSFGQFLFAPVGSTLITSAGWQETLFVFAILMALVVPLSMALAARPTAGTIQEGAPAQSVRQALREAFAERSYILLVLGFFTCGFQLAFITTHLPPYLADAGLSPAVGGWTIALIGLANIFGSLFSGAMSQRWSKKYMLAVMYALRGLAIAVFILAPPTPATSILFGIVIGFLWLSTVPPTSGLVAVMFGTSYLTMLYGFAFFSHQVGAFFGVWLGGLLYETTGSYALVWWLAAFLGFASALINLPIREAPVARVAPAH